MSIMKLKEANCKNCYKCIRECPVKSISFNGEQAQIVDDECVYCGHCLITCPQHAKEIVNDVGKVKALIHNKNRVYVSIAPSYPSYFKGVSMAQMSAALKKLGITQVEETAVGATKVSEEYEKLVAQHKMRNIITTACPTVCMLVQKYYPDLVPYLAPVASPILAHAKSMKEVYGNRIKVVFIGPCISKKHDVEDVTNENLLSAALTFEELEGWLEEEGISFEEEDEEQRGIRKPVARFYPIPGGIIKTIPHASRKGYKFVGVDGMSRCMKILDSLREDDISDYFIEMNACEGACVGGPSLQHMGYFGAKDDLLASLPRQNDDQHYISDEPGTNIHKKYVDIPLNRKIPSEEEIRAILAKTGKTKKEDELNCGGCGYPTCREKAIAVFQGKADVQMCLPYVREKAESMSNLIIDCTPSCIIALDEALCIQEANPAACSLLKMGRHELIGKHIDEVLPCEMYYMDVDPNAEENTVLIEKQHYDQYNITVEQTVVHVKNGNAAMILILKDITEAERHKQETKAMREDTIEITQKVIDKQMRVAQEIASLLGETTAETKVALTKLKKSMGDGGEDV